MWTPMAGGCCQKSLSGSGIFTGFMLCSLLCGDGENGRIRTCVFQLRRLTAYPLAHVLSFWWVAAGRSLLRQFLHGPRNLSTCLQLPGTPITAYDPTLRVISDLRLQPVAVLWFPRRRSFHTAGPSIFEIHLRRGLAGYASSP